MASPQNHRSSCVECPGLWQAALDRTRVSSRSRGRIFYLAGRKTEADCIHAASSQRLKENHGRRAKNVRTPHCRFLYAKLSITTRGTPRWEAADYAGSFEEATMHVATAHVDTSSSPAFTCEKCDHLIFPLLVFTIAQSMQPISHHAQG